MKKFYLEKHVYLPEYNLIINKELENLINRNKRLANCFKKRFRISIDEVEINKIFLKRQLSRIKQITFETTQDCNLRCEYCVYNGSYFYQRRRNNKYMDFRTAKKALETIIEFKKNDSHKNLVISFYGGEPLLNYNFIKEVVNYTKNYLNKKIEFSFAITTNGTLLNEKNINFFIENNFSILISLDGPKDIHDAKRKFVDGSGSFDKIYNNLVKIRRINKHFYETNIGFSSVWSPDLSLQKIYRFFSSDSLVKSNKVRASRVSKWKTNYFDLINYNENREYREREKVLNIIKKKIERKENLLPSDYSFYLDTSKFSNLKYRRFSIFFGSCVFNNKIYVDVDGNFHICHMMNDKFPFGDIKNGFNYEMMKNICESYLKIIRDNCFLCEFLYLCERCFVTFAKDGYFEIDEEYCNRQKKIIPIRIKKFIEHQQNSRQ